MVRAFERESRVRELIQLFVRERDPEKLKVLAAELQGLLILEGAVPKIWRKKRVEGLRSPRLFRPRPRRSIRRS